MTNDRHSTQIGQFCELSFQDQLNTVWQRGRLLDARRVPGFWLHLYVVDTFFVEMWVCQRRYEVTLLRGFDTTDELDPYIDRISLAGLPLT